MKTLQQIQKERFWSRVIKKDGCWEWVGSRSSRNGKPSYGHFYHDHKTISAHKFSYELHKGTVQGGLVVMHSCDNTGCVNPEHLLVGTHKQNTRDMLEKRRFHPLRKLSNEDVAVIKELKSKQKVKEVSKMFGVSDALIYKIWEGLQRVVAHPY